MTRCRLAIGLCAIIVTLATVVSATTVNVLLRNGDDSVSQTNLGIAASNVWSDVMWQPLAYLNDPIDTVSAQIDFVGDANDPGAYYYDNGTYIYFRMRVAFDQITDTNSSGTIEQSEIYGNGAGNFNETHRVLIDVVGQHFDTTTPANQLVAGDDDYADYSFAWDSASGGSPGSVSNHGLELTVRTGATESATTWGTTRIGDFDFQNADKVPEDINSGTRTTDGYIRITDQVPTLSFGTTTFIDFAVSWGYLTTHTDLDPSQEWRVALASTENANDHNFIDEIAGNTLIGAPITDGWTPVPEVSTSILALFGLGLTTLRRRRRSAA